MDLGATGFLAVDQQLRGTMTAVIDVHGHRVPADIKVEMVTPPHHESPWGCTAPLRSMPPLARPRPCAARERRALACSAAAAAGWAAAVLRASDT